MRVAIWRWLLPVFWLAVLGILVCSSAEVLFPVSQPLFGYWDAVPAISGQPFTVKMTGVTPGGASSLAGIRDGDRIDLRRIDRYERVALLFQPITTKPPVLRVEHAGRTFAVTVQPSTITGTNSAWKIWLDALYLCANVLLLVCALILALRRWSNREGRYLCIILLAFVLGGALNFGDSLLSNGSAYTLVILVGECCFCLAALLSIMTAARFGSNSRLRTAVLIAAVSLVLLALAAYLCGAIGLLTLAIDPLPFFLGPWRAAYVAMFAASAVYACVATGHAAQHERARAAWLLLPLPFALFVFALLQALTFSEASWVGYMICWLVGWCAMIAGAVAITYALLIRRVLDVQFIVGRTLVVGGVSAIVVVSFVLLEWLLGAVLAHASHATGLVANAGLALMLGLSMSFIHKRVDAFVDFAFFHRRHENEQALREFGKEAAFVTRRGALLDLTIEKIRLHTDAVFTAILLDGEGVYRTVRSFGDGPDAADENDAVILALKAKHSPVDPHRYPTALSGEVALPMLGRGRVLGVLLCGVRSTGEAYAPDEIAALSDLALGVGLAIDGLERGDDAPLRDDAILCELRALREAVLGHSR